MCDTAGEVNTNSKVTFSYGPLHTDEQVLDDQIELIYNNSVRTQDVVEKTCWEKWMIETNDERELGKSVLPAWISLTLSLLLSLHDDDDNISMQMMTSKSFQTIP